MAQVSYGTITITDTTDLTTFIRYAKQVPLQSVSDFQSAPDTNTHYIAVLSIPSSEEEPLWNSNQWQWSEFIGTDGLSVKNTRTLYYLKTNSSSVPQVDINTQIASTNVQNTWTSINPTYVVNGTYWTCLEVTLSDNTTKSWSAPVEDLGLTSSNSNASNALTQATNANQAVALMGGHFIYRSTESQSHLTVPSANVVQTVKKNGIDVTGDPTQWDYNVHIGANGIKLRNNEIDLSKWTDTGLTFYSPSTTSQGNKAMELTGSNLTFYGSDGETVQAVFGGTGASVKGAITATSLTIDSGASVSGLSTSDITGINNYALKTYADDKANNAEANASYSLEIKVTAINYINNSATLVAVPYYQGSTTLPTLPSNMDYTYQWYVDGVVINGANTTTLVLNNNSNLAANYSCVISKEVIN